MANTTTYTVRTGRPIPIMGNSGAANGIRQYTFGYECQKVITCSTEETVITSEDMCLWGGDWYSASYRALPVKVNKKVLFNATLRGIPQIYADDESGCQQGQGSACSIIKF